MPRLLTFLAWANEHWQSAKRATRRRRSNIGLLPSSCSAAQTVTPSFRPDGNTGKIWHAADGEQLRIVLGADGLFFILLQSALRDRRREKIDRSLAIVVEAA